MEYLETPKQIQSKKQTSYKHHSSPFPMNLLIMEFSENFSLMTLHDVSNVISI